MKILTISELNKLKIERCLEKMAKKKVAKKAMPKMIAQKKKGKKK